jgi:hypothetical protein
VNATAYQACRRFGGASSKTGVVAWVIS